MSSRCLPAAILGLSVLLVGSALAQEDAKETVPPEKVDAIVEARAEKERKEEREDKPEGADPGESSYNVSDCGAAWKGEKVADGSSGGGSDPEGAQDQVDDCENVKK